MLEGRSNLGTIEYFESSLTKRCRAMVGRKVSVKGRLVCPVCAETSRISGFFARFGQKAKSTYDTELKLHTLDLAARVEAEVIKQQETKRGLSIKSEAQDKGIRLLRLRADLQIAIENENYSLAAELRHQDTELWFVEWIQCVVKHPPGWKTQMLTTAFICSL
ncbi:hypothetical protein L2E82_22994 [Cichorium intybus]|uniref:Uncharacterized protein n=1 Tax=Cichorium intybus TaxID=13427 RepID=A0ACB9E0B6_CICIN|nr:hypothetical protein L2E82_22994 [Cichorium intybus]